MWSRVALVVALGTLFSATVLRAQLGADTAAANSPGIAVVELFTSQGCSSCPAADALLQRLANDRQNGPVYVLSFHVDYWNRLGWTDPYSLAYSTQRQRAYAKASGNDQVYTPQMIVNGDVQFVGSDSKKAASAINASLRQATPTKVKVKATAEKGNSVRVEYIVVGQAKGTVLNIAAVVPFASNEVPRGENSGRTLKHVNVVRAFQFAGLDEAATGELVLRLPSDRSEVKASIIAYVQDPQTLHISGATQVAL